MRVPSPGNLRGVSGLLFTSPPAGSTLGRPRKRLLSVSATRLALPGALAAIIIFAAAIRVYGLVGRPYWFDESVTAGLVHLDLGSMLTDIRQAELNPPLYEVIGWIMTHGFGMGEFGLRLLSVAFGTATVGVAYAIATTLSSRRIGLVVAALVAANPLLVWYSREARPYALLALLCSISLFFFCRWLRTGSGKHIALWALSAALALCAQYFALFFVLPQALWLLIATRFQKRTVAATALVGAVGAALLPLALYQRAGGAGWLGLLGGLWDRIGGLWRPLLAGYDSEFVPGIGLAVLAAALAAAGITLAIVATTDEVDTGSGRWFGERGAARIGGVFAAAAIGIPVLFAVFGSDYILERNFLAAVVPIAIVLGAGFGARQAGRFGLVAAAGLFAVSVALVFAQTGPALSTDNGGNQFKRVDWRDIAHALGGGSDGARALVAPQGAMPMGLYRPQLRTMPPHAAVDEIDVLARGNGEDAKLPTGFTLTERTVIGQGYTLVRFRSRGPVSVDPRAVLGEHDYESLDRVLFYEPPGEKPFSPRATAMGVKQCGKPVPGRGRTAIRQPCSNAYLAR